MSSAEIKELTETKAVLKGLIDGSANYEDMTFSGKMVARLLDTNMEKSVLYGQEKEREELVCRLLASGMTAPDVSVILNIRLDAVRTIEDNNSKILIPEYAKTLKSRRKYREKQSN